MQKTNETLNGAAPSQNGLVTQSNGAMSVPAQGPDNIEVVDRALERLRLLLRSPENATTDKLKTAASFLSEPAPQVWISARVAALLSPYYEKDIPHGVRKMEADDWVTELHGYPQWAIERAVRWWKSSKNPDRRKRPMEGDISARVRFEMGPVRAAETYARMGGVPAHDQGDRGPRCTADQAAAALKRARFNLRRMEAGDAD